MDNSDMILHPAEAVDAHGSMMLHLKCYSWLALYFFDLRRPLFKMRPKCHYMSHMGGDVLAWKLNCNLLHTFQEEGFLGRVKAIATKTHGRTMTMRTMQRYLLFLAVFLNDNRNWTAWNVQNKVGYLKRRWDGRFILHEVPMEPTKESKRVPEWLLVIKPPPLNGFYCFRIWFTMEFSYPKCSRFPAPTYWVEKTHVKTPKLKLPSSRSCSGTTYKNTCDMYDKRSQNWIPQGCVKRIFLKWKYPSCGGVKKPFVV